MWEYQEISAHIRELTVGVHLFETGQDVQVSGLVFSECQSSQVLQDQDQYFFKIGKMYVITPVII